MALSSRLDLRDNRLLSGEAQENVNHHSRRGVLRCCEQILDAPVAVAQVERFLDARVRDLLRLAVDALDSRSHRVTYLRTTTGTNSGIFREWVRGLGSGAPSTACAPWK